MSATTIQQAALGSRHASAPRTGGLFQALVRTGNDWAPTILRVSLALIIFPHGAQKALGWFGGYGIGGTLGFFGSMGIPTVFGILAIAAEFLGAIGLAVGLLSRVAAFGIASTMAVAAVMVHLPNGFFMNWSGKAAGEGFEYHLLVIAMALVIMLKGGGRASVDRALTRDA
ncbi:MAG TPA: DoxX family protein [Longimicrobiaceae bacterium]|nr:DoxX family protein [Longimicrobiaceae bacterium]